MIESLRLHADDGARYAVTNGEGQPAHIHYRWAAKIGDDLAPPIIALMRDTTESAPIIGFAEQINDDEANAYIAELRANLAAGKVRLLTIFADDGTLIGLCTLRRNLNPNNRHITDLAKGMIHRDHRGGAVLPAAFVEIALQCEADGVELVTLDVRADTPAHRIWTHFGFETYGVLPDYARAQGKTHAGHFMMQKVPDLKQRAAGRIAALLQPAAGRDDAAEVRTA